MGTWDKGLDFDNVRAVLGKRAEEEERKINANEMIMRDLSYLYVLLTQLANGSRISEAFESVTLWANDGNRIQMVRARKHGQEIRCDDCKKVWKYYDKVKTVTVTDGGVSRNLEMRRPWEVHREETGHEHLTIPSFIVVPRRMVMPVEVKDENRAIIHDMLDGLGVGAVKMYAIKKLNFNTHSLRFANIGKQGELNIASSITAKITKHANENEIITYQQQKTADRIQDAFAAGKKPKV